MRPICRLLCVLAAVLFGAGCGDRGSERLAEIGQCVEEQPDSALAQLLAIDPSTLSRREDARRRLLLAKLHNRAEDPRLNDSLLRPAMAWYERRGTERERAEAWYYYSQVRRAAGDPDEAVRGTLQAMLHAERAGHTALLGVLHHCLGKLYLEQRSAAEAEECFSRAGELGRRTGDRELELYSRFMVSSAQYADGRYADAIATVRPLIEVRDTIPFRVFVMELTLQNLLYHLYAGDWTPDELLRERARIDTCEYFHAPLRHGSSSTDDVDRMFYDTASAIIFLRAGQLDSARCHARRMLDRTTRFDRNNKGIYRIASEIYRREGDDRRALECAERYIELSDSIDRAWQGVEVASLERRYRAEHEAKLGEMRSRYRMWIAALGCLLLGLTAVWAVAGYRRRLRRSGELLDEYLVLIESYRESHAHLTSRLDASGEREREVKQLLEGRFALLRELAATCYTHGEGERLAARVKALALSPAALADVVRMADLYSDGAVTAMRQAFPEWTARNHDFAALVVAGFSPQEICVMLGMTLNGVYTLKSKLKRRIAAAPAEVRKRFARFFE